MVLIANTAEEFLKYIPIVGIPVGSVVSVGTTYYSLQKILDYFEETQMEIWKYLKENRKI